MIDSEEAAFAFVAARGDPPAIEKLRLFAEELARENTQQNLISRASLAHIWQRHFADSAQLLDCVPRETRSWLDLGSGAGLPGVVLACLCPDSAVHLVESRKRRIEWLSHIRELLRLDNCVVHGANLQSVPSFDAGVITARAFAPLPKLLSLSARFSTDDTYWVLPKGRSAAQEYQELPRKLRSMFHVKQSSTDREAGILLGHGRVGEGA